MVESSGNTIEALHGIATELQSQDSVEDVCALTVDAAARVLEFSLCTIVIREGEWLVPYATSDDAPPDGSRRMRLTQGLAGESYQSGQSRIVDRVEPDDGTDPAKPSYRSGFSVPIGEHGVFQAVSTTEAAFDEDDVELAELLVSHARTALDRIEREQELEQQVERLDQFASVVSHDLRNPLAVARGHLELVRKERDSESLREIAAAHERMERLIDDLLTFALVGTRALDRETVDLARLTQFCWTNLEPNDATLHVDTTQQVDADRDRLRQLVENLLSNAVNCGGTDVSVTVGETDGGFYIEDDGPGIPADERTAVFEAGYSPGPEGTGFGLSVVEQVVEAHDWEIRLTDGSSGGARFEITGVESATE
ncbi:histidine kinase [Halobacteriales archaeon SW_5_70_135]|nr:MAG: histidine kinase [Halobacteriales archaeon SW_5_70_135]